MMQSSGWNSRMGGLGHERAPPQHLLTSWSYTETIESRVRREFHQGGNEHAPVVTDRSNLLYSTYL